MKKRKERRHLQIRHGCFQNETFLDLIYIFTCTVADHSILFHSTFALLYRFSSSSSSSFFSLFFHSASHICMPSQLQSCICFCQTNGMLNFSIQWNSHHVHIFAHFILYLYIHLQSSQRNIYHGSVIFTIVLFYSFICVGLLSVFLSLFLPFASYISVYLCEM